ILKRYYARRSIAFALQSRHRRVLGIMAAAIIGCRAMVDLQKAVARYGADAKAKLANPAATGEPEDQLRAPLEALFADLAELCGFPRGLLAAVGESSLAT